MVIAALTPAYGCSCAADAGLVEPPIASGDGGGGHGAAAGSGSGGGEGQGGGTAPARVRTSETVTAGEVAKSARYRMVFTLGQPTQNQSTTTSPRYRMQGGLIGATGSLP
ncbi:hypothetical protein WMF18_11710 [Sorangium sp. So ce315]|uniref:hypothetical protein n=1 Tax=Sorangium sp. So ce315 TaxID=3133299 RepID=UPI003F5E9EAC